MNNFYLASRRLLPAVLLTLLGGLPAALAQAPANDNPCAATVLLPNGTLCTTPTVSDNTGATTTNPNGYTNPGNTGGCGIAQAPKDVWFQFTTAASGPASFGAAVTVTGNPAGQVRLFSAASCAGPFTQVACSGSGTVNTVAPRLTTGSLAPNTTYYILVAGYGSNDTQGQFTICLTNGPGTPTCGNPVRGTVTNTGNGTATLNFTPGLNNVAPFVLTYRDASIAPAQPTVSASTNSSPFLLTGLIPGHVYSYTLGAACPLGGQGSTTGSLVVPVANDDPCNAVALPALTVACAAVNSSLNGSTRSAAVPNNPGNGCYQAGFGQAPGDVWFTFRTNASGAGSTNATVQVQGNAAHGLTVYNSPANCANTPYPTPVLGCSVGGGSGTGSGGWGGEAVPLVLTNLAPNTLYYVAVSWDGYDPNPNTGQGLFNLCVTSASGGCNILMNNPSAFNVTSTGAQLVAGASSPSVTGYVFTVTPQGGSPVTYPATPTGRLQVTGLAPGTTYRVAVAAVCANGGQSSPTFTTFTTTSVAGPPNDTPCTAQVLPINASCAPVTGTTVGANGSTVYTGPNQSQTCGTANPSASVWYTITTAASGPASTGAAITVTGTAAGQLWAFSAATCQGPFTYRGCSGGQNNPATAAAPLILSGLTPSTTYYIRVAALFGFGASSNGPFTICATPPAACADPTAVGVTNVTMTGAQLNFTPAVGISAYQVSYGPAGGTQTTLGTNPTASPVVLSGLTTNTNYTVTIQSVCAAGLGLPITTTFRTTGLPGTNSDECSGATPIPTIGVGTCGPLVAGDNTTATASAGVPAPSCANGSAPIADVWFSLTVPANGVVQVTTSAATGSPFNDSVLELYTGACSSLTSVGCNDDTNGLFSQVRAMGLVAGSTVFARVRNYGTTSVGAFNICAQTDAACPAVSNVQVSGIGFSGATLTFGGPSNGTSYAITLTPAGGGSPITTTATASPVVLSGLTQNTTYAVSIVTSCTGGLTSLPGTATFTTAPVCPAPTQVFVNGTTTTSVVVNFTPPAGGTSYVVTATPTAAGGTPVSAVTPGGPYTLTGLLPGTTYTLSVVATCGPGQTSPAATINAFSTLALPPANDNCAGAVPLSITTTCTAAVAGTLAGSTQSIPATPSCGFAQSPINDVWYSFVAGAVPLSLTVLAQTSQVVVDVRQGTCAGSNSVACGMSSNANAAFTLNTGVLTAGQTYFVRLYPSNPGVAQNAQFAGFTICLTPVQGYCITNLGGSCGSPDVTNVALPTTTLANPTAPCTGGGGSSNYYTAFPAAGSTTASLQQGSSYPFSVTTNGNADVSVWVDYNHDFVFDPSEWVQAITSSVPNLPAAATLTVPANAALGQTMMRVRSRSAGAGNGATDACTTFASGRTQDYSITIVLRTGTRADQLAAQVGLYPNPARGAFQLSLPGTLSRQPVPATLLNALGQVVQQRLLPAQPQGLSATFDVSALPPGVYSLRLTTPAGPVAKRLVVE